MSAARIASLALVGVGGLVLVFALIVLVSRWRFLRGSATAQGTVTDLVYGSGSAGGASFPVVDFMTAEGVPVRFREPTGSDPPRFKPGEAVTVRYDPRNPQSAYIPRGASTWVGPLTWLLLGGAMVGGGVPWFLSLPPEPEREAAPAATAEAQPLRPLEPPGKLPTFEPPEVPPAGATLVVQGPAGARPVASSCASYRLSGDRLQVRLRFEGGALTFSITGVQGPGAYTVGLGVEVGGSYLGTGGSPHGAVILNDGMRSGVVNLVNGNRGVSGGWRCQR